MPTVTTSDDTTVTRRLARFLATAATSEPPAGAQHHATLHLLDTLASIVACRDLRAAEVATAYTRRHGTGDVPILGSDERASLLDAAFASAIIAHGAEINDFCPSAFVQPGPSVVSTALCLGRQRRRSGEETIRAVAAGYEVACRLPRAIGNEALRRHGVANHSLGSLFGTATTAAALLRLDEDQAVDLIAFCAQQASGSWQWLLDVEHLEKSFVFGGMAVHNGLHAALLVEAGFTGVPDALDVDGGWLAGGILDGADRSLSHLVDDLGSAHTIDLVGYKRFPVGGPVQPIVQGVLELVEAGLDGEVDAVHIEMPGAADTFANARMPALNARYLVALILLEGRLDFVAAQSLERFRNDTAVHALMDRIRIEHDPSQETDPRSESARIRIDLVGGGERSIFVDHVRGYPSHPMNDDEVIDKARTLLATQFSADRVGHIVDTVLSIATLPTVDPIIDAIAPA